MKKFKEFIKKLPVGYVGLDADHLPLVDLVKKYGPNLPTGFAGFLRKPEDDLGDPKNRDVKEEAPPPIPKTIKIPEYHYDHVVYHPNRTHTVEDHPEHKYHEWSDTILPTFGHHRDTPKDHIAAIKKYTEFSGDLNRVLIKKHVGGKLSAGDIAGYDPNVHHRLMEVAAKHRTHGPMTLYSGVGLTHPGHHPDVHLPAFTSMSHDPVIARNFAKPDVEWANPQNSSDKTHMIHWGFTTHNGGSAILHPDHVKEYYTKHFDKHFTDRAKFAHSIGHHYGMPKDMHHDSVSPPYMINHMLQIHVPTGSHVVVPGIHTNFPEEKEVIAPAGSNIRLDHTKMPRLYRGGTMVHHVNLETPKL